LLVLKPVLINFWNIYASSFEPFADPKPAKEFFLLLFKISVNFLDARSNASSQEAFLKYL